MAHHKRRRSKDRRAGCLMCKPHKMCAWSKERPEVLHRGFGPIRDKAHAQADLNDLKKNQEDPRER